MFEKLKQQARRFFKDDRGVAAALGAILLPTIIGASGLAVDGTRYMRAKQIIISAADQAALSAASIDIQAGGQTRKDIASNFFTANIPTEYKNVIKLKDFSFTDESKEKGAVIVTYVVNATVTPLIASAIGIEDFNVKHEGTAVREISNIEVVMALPMSGTMCSIKNRTPSPQTSMLVGKDITLDLKPDPDCKHFNAMKTGVKAFSDMMFKNQTVTRFSLGLIPYNYKIRMPDTRRIPPLMLQGENGAPGFFTDLSDANPLPVIMPLTKNQDKINLSIKSLSLNERGTAWSRTNLPTLAAAHMFDPTQTEFFYGGEMPAAFSDGNISKIFILLTDGSNIGCCFTNWQPGDFSKQYVYFHKPDNDQQLAYCKAMKDAGITIFTIIFDVSENDAGGKEINNIFARCASGAYSEKGVREDDDRAELLCKNKQNCYNVGSAKQLIKAYEDIAQNYFIARTSR